MQRAVGAEQALHDASRVAVDRERGAGRGHELDDADRRGVHQRLLVLVGEFLPALLLAEEEVPDVQAPVTHRGRLERPAGDQARRKPERADMLPEVGEPERAVKAAQNLEQPRPGARPSATGWR